MFSTLDSALSLAAKGLRVFPLAPGSKTPLYERFQFQATSDVATIRELWSRPESQGCNVGVLTTDMVVVDLDVKKVNGIASYESVDGATWDTLVVRSPSGGYHTYFDGPDSRLQVQVLPGVDIRSHNGYVVGPGSWTQAIPGAQAEGFYEIVYDRPLAWVPPGIATLLKPPRSAAGRDDGFGATDAPAAVASALAWLSAAPAATEGQGGDNLTYQTAAKLVRDFALTADAAFSILSAEWNERCSPPWSPADLWLKITNAQEYAAGDIGAAQPAMQFNAVTVQPPPVHEEPPARTASELGVYMGNLLDPSELRPRAWKVRGLLLSRDVTVLAGMGAAGKSTIQLTAAAHFAVGKDFGPWKLSVPGVPLRTVVYNAEDDVHEQSRRLFAICSLCKLDYQAVRQNIAIMDDSMGELNLAYTEHGNPKQNEKGVEFVVNTIAHLGADLAFFDPLLNLHTLDENSNPHMRFFLTLMRNMARATSCSILLAHHSSKGSGTKDKGDVDVVRGAGSIVNSSRLTLVVSAMTKEEAELYGITRLAHKFIRIDKAKENYGARTGGALAYMEWHSINTPFNETMGALQIVDVGSKERMENVRLASIIVQHMQEAQTGSILRKDAIEALKAGDDMMRVLSTSSLYRRVDALLLKPIDTPNGTLSREGDKVVLT